ncbi:flagellar FlbD family protein [Caldicellulosiruptor acetigenus I77R1B]|uniref:Flagellar FlbD family protein n=2 Tax=Caldicellulosiruptor acetigenus TaxID=301953 RepID=G2PUW7_9FIRM|nr:flagellar FlbD family protein [Caldicellulosiruptor acetigenus]ADQ39967.1 flagellar FlbD family protein [Caldicellulosiruptor acetigenus I77R1B]AEM74519.1 flagellar FlbD family protein [Caldicellulosiruptor acetigenus 6A]
MIKLRRINNKEFVVNADFIEFVESTPDTVITLTNGVKLVVKESVDEVIEKVIEYKKRIFEGIIFNIQPFQKEHEG